MIELALPEGWNSNSLETFLCFALGGDWGKSADYDDPEFETVYCIRGTEISHWAKTSGSTAVERKIKVSSLEKRRLQEGDILVEISGGGPDQPVGRTVVIDQKVLNKFETDNVICTNFLRMFRPTRSINPKFLNFYLQMFYSSGYINEYQSGSNNLRNLKFKEFLTIDVPLAPIDEQNAIVSELEKHFETVSQIQARLDAIPKLIEKFRQSVLNDAVSGKLTEEWRSKHNQSDVFNFVEEIFSDREQLVKNKKLKPKFLKKSEVDSLYEVPDTWGFYGLEDICSNDNYALKAGPFGSALKKSDCVSSGHKVYGQEQVISQNENLETYFVSDEKFDELKNCATGSKDILISLVGTIGKVLILSEKAEIGIINPRLVKISLNESISREYIKTYLDSSLAKDFFKTFSHGGTMDILNLGILKKLPIPLPPIEEQHEIVKQVEQLLHYSDQIEKSVATAKARVDHLTQSILHQAFTGNLTSEWREQNPELISGDNSAEALLARIKAEKQDSSKKGKVKK